MVTLSEDTSPETPHAKRHSMNPSQQSLMAAILEDFANRLRVIDRMQWYLLAKHEENCTVMAQRKEFQRKTDSLLEEFSLSIDSSDSDRPSQANIVVNVQGNKNSDTIEPMRLSKRVTNTLILLITFAVGMYFAVQQILDFLKVKP